VVASLRLFISTFFAAAAPSGTCFQSDQTTDDNVLLPHSWVVVTWIVAIPRLVYVKALDYLVVNAVKAVINRPA
ncbi:hypothetical protein B0H14DRAFT_2959261, partial [Mycena olivaceomarginata]